MLLRSLLSIVLPMAMCFGMSPFADAESPSAAAVPERSEPVDFSSEILPLLQRNCIACHNAKQPEGGLVLESHARLLEGGDSGPGIVPAETDTSTVWLRASGSEEPLMPPEDNAVGAKPLSPEQLDLLKLWIEQGAVPGSVASEPALRWQPIPENLQPIYALDVSPDGQWVASGRGNQVVVSRIATGEGIARLIDPAVEEKTGTAATNFDLVQSVAFSPDGQRIATGGYRTVKLWRRSYPQFDSAALAHGAGLVARSPDGKRLAIVNAIGDIEIWDADANERLLTLSAHDATVTGLAFGGERLFSSDASGRVIAWDTTSAQPLAVLASDRLLAGLVATNTGDLIAGVDAGKRVVVWRFQTVAGEPSTESQPAFEAAEFPGASGISDATSVALLDAPRLLAVGTETGAVVLLSLEKGEELRRVNHGAPVQAIAADPAGVLLATGGQEGITRLWTAATGDPAAVVEGDPDHRLATARTERAFTRQQAVVDRMTARTAALETVSKSESDAAAKVQETRNAAAEKLAAEEKKLADAVAQVAATEAAIATAKQEAEAAQKAAETAEAELAKLEAAPPAEAESEAAGTAEQATQEPAAAPETSAADPLAQLRAQIELSRTAAAEATARAEQALAPLEQHKKAVADAEQSKQTAATELAQHEQTLAAARQAVERAAAAVPLHVAQVEHEKRRAADLQRRHESAQARAAASRSGVVAVAFSPDSATVATAHINGDIRVHRTSDGQPLVRLERAGEVVAGLQFLTNPTLVAFTRHSPPAAWSLQPRWELERTIGSIEESPISDRVTAVDFDPDGLLLAVGSGPPSRQGEVKVFAVHSGELLGDFDGIHSDNVLGLRFSPDGETLASAAADKTIRLLDVSTGETLRSLEGHTHHVLAIAWQNDGQTLASASADNSVKVWNTESGEQQRTIGGFSKEITAIDFVGQLSHVVTAAADGHARLHNAADGAQIRAFAAAGDFLYAVAASPDGTRLLAGGQEGVLRAWTIADGALLWENR